MKVVVIKVIKAVGIGRAEQLFRLETLGTNVSRTVLKSRSEFVPIPAP